MPVWIAIVLLGIIEGITEFLPVSSTGHLLIAEHWLNLQQSDLFNVVIQCGAVMAVLPLFPERLRQFAFNWRATETQQYAAKILLAFAITGAGGLIMEKLGMKLPEKLAPVAWAVFVGGIAFIGLEAWLKGRKTSEEVTWTIAIAVGLAQLVAAAFPGTSRSGATILIALALGLSRVGATEFTFLVGIPTMMAAGMLKIYKAIKIAGVHSEDWSMVALGFVVSAIVSFLAVKWLLRYIQTHTFVVFGWYRVALAAVIAAALLTR
jgi:undecaprenyl-diphosphatase